MKMNRGWMAIDNKEKILLGHVTRFDFLLGHVPKMITSDECNHVENHTYVQKRAPHHALRWFDD